MAARDAAASTTTAATSAVERATMRKVMWRLLPLLMLSFATAAIDRANVGFAAKTMDKDLGFTSGAFGFGAGIFFWGYFLFEIPSNLALNRVGARLWIARIMLTWSVISAATAFVWDERSFYAARFLLGAAEAGFYPGVVLYITWWFPRRYRARAVGVVMTALAFSNVVGALVSGWLLGLDGAAGLHGWQWLFLLEAIPPVVLGVAILALLPDRPQEARWLGEAQRGWLVGRLAEERADAPAGGTHSLAVVLRDPRVWAFTLVYFAQNVTGYGLGLFLPQILSKLGATPGRVGLLTAMPYAFGIVAMTVAGVLSDRTGRRALLVIGACLLSCVGLAASSRMADPVWMMVLIVAAQMGQSSIGPTFWPLPTAMMSGVAAAGGIALINSVGNLGGFVGPWIMGVMRDATGSFSAGMLVIASGAGIAAAVVAVVTRRGASARAPERVAPAA